MPDEDLYQHWRRTNSKVVIVFPEWIVSSVYNNERSDCSQYIIKPNGSSSVASSAAVLQRIDSKSDSQDIKPTLPNKPQAFKSLPAATAKVMSQMLSSFRTVSAQDKFLEKLSQLDHEEQDLDPAELDRRKSARSTLFKGISFAFDSSSDAELQSNLTIHVECGGGRLTSAENADVVLCPACNPSSKRPNNATQLWLETCMVNAYLHPVTAYSLFAPVNTIPGQGWQDAFKILLSGFSTPDHEWDYIQALLAATGLQQTKGWKQVQVVVCRSQAAGKFEPAQRKGKSCVSIQWLLSSIEAGRPLATGDFPVPVSDELVVADANSLFDPVTDTSSAKRSAGDQDDPNANTPTTKKPKFEVGTAINLLQTPAVNKLKRTQSLDTPGEFAKNITRAAKLTSNDNIQVFDGVVVSLSRACANQYEQLSDMVARGGGKATLMYDANTTHFIHAGRPERTSTMAAVKRSKTPIVHPEWLVQSLNAGCLLPTADYPPQFKAGRSLATKRVPALRAKLNVQTKPVEHKNQPPSQAQSSPKTESPDTTRAAKADHSPDAKPDSLESNEPAVSSIDVTDSQLIERVEVLCANLKAGGRPASAKRELTSASPAVPISSHASTTDATDLSTNAATTTDSTALLDTTGEPDPKRRGSHLDFASALSNVAVTYQDPESLRRKALSERDQMVFMTTNMSHREHATAVLTGLGCKVLNENHFIFGATHVLVGKPCRNEKYLAGCAAGLWVLCADEYVASCEKAGFMVPEEQFEWTADRAKARQSQETQLAAAAQYWRRKVQDNRCRGAFEAWRVVLLVGEKGTLPCFQRLLEAGAGQLLATNLSPQAELSAGLKTATHILCDCKLRDFTFPSGTNVRRLRVLKLEYMAEYLKNPKAAPDGWTVSATQVFR
eukprot:TRINITY_DN11320_c0_g1_i3.p1 TRINITY_DN11320_c0_g1~~TRINITY_DN11320_c0_g1_i3.p1  ORF type:complete len:934 (+),score=188.69 TRINITY_DN11320_c0_g1_i3:121-2802(+)